MAEIREGDTHPADARRYHVNQPAPADDAWLRAHLWLARRDKSTRIEDGDTIVLGFHAFTRFKVVGMYADPTYGKPRDRRKQAYARKLRVTAGAHPMQRATSRASAVDKAAASFEEAVLNGDLSHDCGARLTERARPWARVQAAGVSSCWTDYLRVIVLS